MVVTILKEHYVLVLAEDRNDLRWLDQNGYESVGEDYFQLVFTDFNDFLEEVKYLKDYNAHFESRNEDDDPQSVLNDLIEEDFIRE